MSLSYWCSSSYLLRWFCLLAPTAYLLPLFIMPLIPHFTMTTKKMTTLIATVATLFLPITHQPINYDLAALCEVLYPLLLDILYDEERTHNLIRIIQPTASDTVMMGFASSIPPCLPAWPALVNDNSAVVCTCPKEVHTILLCNYATYESWDAINDIW